MEDCDPRVIQVRTITGESTSVSVPTHSTTIEDLKLLLKQSFPPASNSPNFHLFFKGVKLRLQSRISAHRIERGEFLVLVPFTKKDPSRTQNYEQSKTSSTSLNNSSISKFADSVWSNVMQDLSYLRATQDNATLTTQKVGSFSLGDRTATVGGDFSLGDTKETVAGTSSSCSFEAKRKRDFDFDNRTGLSYDHILSTLQLHGKDVLEEHNREVFVKVLKSVSCLSAPGFELCLLLRKANFCGGAMGVGPEDGSSCLCPEWLKMIMKAFAFLNIFSAFLHLQQKKITTTHLEEALNQLEKSGIKLSMKDIEHLSVLCPKGVRFSENEMDEASLGDTLVIINRPTQQKDQVDDNPKTARKRLSVPKIVSALKRRETAFKTNMLRAVEFFASKNGTEMITEFSLEDLLLLMKNHGTAASRSEPKRTKRSMAASSSDSADPLVHKTGSRDGVLIGPQAGSSWLYVYPEGIYDLLNYTKTEYGDPEIYITENGVNELNNASLPLKEALEDTHRIDYHYTHLEQVHKAIGMGVKVKAYFAWSFLDTFEWFSGFTIRFGIHYIDYENELKRYPKLSAEWFKNFLKK